MYMTDIKNIVPVEQITTKGSFLAEINTIKNPNKQISFLIDTEKQNMPDYVLPNNYVRVINMPTEELQKKFGGKNVYVLNLGIPINFGNIIADKTEYTKGDKIYHLIPLQSIIAIDEND